jgi:TatD DNase family protein
VKLVDTHCHLDTGYFPEGADAVIARANEAGVDAFMVIGVGEPRIVREAVALAERRSDVVAAIGVHPHEAADLTDAFYDEIEALSAHPRVRCIGEIGLDFHYDHSPRERQAEVFRRFIALARKVQKPIVIHTREAAPETLAILREENARDVGGIIHCFSEDRAFAEAALDLGFDLSFSGILTFKTAKAIQEAAVFAPADRLLVETDAPYLAPVPLRGKKCEPAYVAHTATFLASLRGVDRDDLVRTTTENARRRLGPDAFLALSSPTPATTASSSAPS